MSSTHLRLSIATLSLISSLWQLVAAEPVQYCKFGDSDNPNGRVDFCMGAVLHRNASTSSHDLLLSFTHIRRNGSKLGWTAIGLGNIMEGSLMFVVYGDPISSQAPVVSIRGSTGHHQPTLLSRADAGGADLRVVQAAWAKSTGASEGTGRHDYVAQVHLICYSCPLWPGALISATAKSQPWIWAWNPHQDFAVFSFDAHLEMHAHHSTSGGFGIFFVDMTRAVNNVPRPVSLPPISPHIAMLGTSETPAGLGATFLTIALNPTLHLHALLMGIAFFVLFPAGIFAMRSGAKTAFRYHWVLQLAGSTSIFCSMILGLIMRQNINTVHQSVGVAIAVATGLQGILGWRHHVELLETGDRTWLSDAHVLLGRLVMIAGWSNVVIGMMLYGYSIRSIFIVGALGLIEMAGIILWVWRINCKKNVVQEDSDGPSEDPQRKEVHTPSRGLQNLTSTPSKFIS